MVRAAVLLAYFLCLSAVARAVPRILTYPCQLPLEPTPDNMTQLWPNLCVTGRAAAYLFSFRLGGIQQKQLIHGVQIYGGLHISPAISLHYLFTGRNADNTRAIGKARWQERRIDHYFLQLGNSYLSANSLSFGTIDLPFGLNHRPFFLLMEDLKDTYWNHGVSGIRLTRKNRNDTKYELGVGFQPKDHWQDTLKDAEPMNYSFRASIDLADLEGTKIIASAYTTHDYQRKYGLALLNDSQGARTSLEWIRSYETSADIDFLQLFRLNYMSPRVRSKQTIFQYENDRSNYWQATVQARYYIMAVSFISLLTGYRHDFTRQENRGWLFSMGIELKQ